MNRFKYLELLSAKLSGAVPEEDYNDIMQYYTEYFTEAGAQNEQAVIEELGSPEELAAKIISGVDGKQTGDADPAPKKKLAIGWVITIAILGSPIWLSLLCVAISVIAVIFALIITVGAVAVAGIFSMLFLVIGGIIELFSSPASGVLVIGTGFVMAALGTGALMLFVLIVNSTRKLFKSIHMKKKYKGVVR